MTVQDTIEQKLRAALAPSQMTIVNESHLHHGHKGSPGTGDSHFRVEIISERFHGTSRIERHRMVNDILAEELAGPIHALAIRAAPPEDAAS
ncbi:DNA-binding transcriptional regulator BolA [bacterium MnTg02]|nr:DNA-binding transcriptional regulator BolA [bacterium MnTg02]